MDICLQPGHLIETPSKAHADIATRTFCADLYKHVHASLHLPKNDGNRHNNDLCHDSMIMYAARKDA